MSKQKRRSAPVTSENGVSNEVKKDTSRHVHQKEKINFELKIRERDDLTDKQKNILTVVEQKNTKAIYIDGLYGSSKAQPLDSKVLTPYGWTNMGDISVGTEILTPKNEVVNVLGIFPQGIKDIYKVIFSDGSFTECTLDHLWFTQTEAERNRRSKIKGTHRIENGKRKNDFYKNPLPPQVRTLQEIKDTLIVNEHLNHAIPMVKPIEFSEKTHFIHSYLLGCLIGDGSMTTNTPSFTCADNEIVEEMKRVFPENITIRGKGIQYNICDLLATWQKPNRVTRELKRLHLHGHKSYTKFIPDEYLFDSVENRINLLRGLMDTDGTTGGFHSSFCTVSEILAKNVQFLVQSLGGTAITARRKNYYTYRGERKQGADSYNVSVKLNNINPFFLPRKRDRVKERTKYFPIRYVSAIEYIGKKECQCILIDSEDHLYITDDFIVTHNTYLATLASLRLLNQKKVDEIIFIRNPVESSSTGKIGFIPGTSEEKMAPYNAVLFDKLEELIPEEQVVRLKKDGRINCYPVGFVRGRSWNCKAIIVDEASSMSWDDLFLILTRCGEFTRIFFIGDSENQNDIGSKSGFKRMFQMFNDQECRDFGIHCFELKELNDIVRSGLLRFVMVKAGLIKRETLNNNIDLTRETSNRF